MTSSQGLIATFTGHRVAANLLMILMLLAGWIGLQRLNTQMMPTFEFDYITVNIPWRGASAEDVERSITLPVEQSLRTLPNVRKLIARSQQGAAAFFLEMEEGADLGLALDDVKQRIDSIRNLPADAENAVVKKIDRFSPIANILVYSENGSLEELRPLVRKMEDALLARGIGQVNFAGLPEEEMAIQIPSSTLHQLGLTLGQIANRIATASTDSPAGTAGRDEAAKQLRAMGQQRDEDGFAQLPLITDEQGQRVLLGDVATIERRPRDNQSHLTFRGYPAIEIQLLRAENDDSLESAARMQQWVADTRPTLPNGVKLHVYFETWKHLEDRIITLLNNGLSGLFLVVATLFFFLNSRVALWVTVGIPVSFMATLGVLYFLGGTINMISLFGLILALGVIVDDAIVVGEDTLTHYQQGEPPFKAALGGAKRMFWPVMASSMTTIAAFLPLGMMGGAMGKIAFDIPFVMICVILASLVECFLVLPGHLHHSLHRAGPLSISPLRQKLDDRFNHFRDHTFRRWVSYAIAHRYATVTLAFASFFVALVIVGSGRLPFTFFPPFDSDQLRAIVEFTSGTERKQVDAFLTHLEDTLHETEEAFEDHVVVSVVQQHGAAADYPNLGGSSIKQGNEYGTLIIEVNIGDDRSLTNEAFIAAWRERIHLPAGLEQLTIAQPEAGPPGKPIELKLTGADMQSMKQASLALQDALAGFAGVSNVDDDMPWGKEQRVLELTPQARALGLTLSSVAAQLRAAFDGELAQMFNEEDEEVEVRVMLPDAERNHLATLERLPIITPAGTTLPLHNAVTFSSHVGVELLRRVEGQLSIIVSANLDTAQGNANEIIRALKQDVLPDLQSHYGIEVSYEGKLQEQAENLQDVKTGQFLALALIYLILAWVFSSYSWPIAIMTAILFGFTGAVIGHIIMSVFGVKFSMFSVMGLFGLSGIIVNDSIVLISFYKQLLEDGMDYLDAIIEACTRRLRAVLLTSITTVAGLTPILFETSLQAQFLKPMAVSIVFGLAFGTVLILAVVPSMLMILEEQKPRLAARLHALAQWLRHPQALWSALQRAWQWQPHTPVYHSPLAALAALQALLAPVLLLANLLAMTLIAVQSAVPVSHLALLTLPALTLLWWGYSWYQLLHGHDSPAFVQQCTQFGFMLSAILMMIALAVMDTQAHPVAPRLAQLAWWQVLSQGGMALLLLPVHRYRQPASPSPATPPSSLNRK